MNDETLAALERTLQTLDAITVDAESRADAALIRALIERERGGGERAQDKTDKATAWDGAIASGKRAADKRQEQIIARLQAELDDPANDHSPNYKMGVRAAMVLARDVSEA